jgi:hypothetical protein
MMDDAWSWMGSWDDARKGRHRGTVPFAPAMSVALQRKSRPGFALERGVPGVGMNVCPLSQRPPLPRRPCPSMGSHPIRRSISVVASSCSPGPRARG